MLVNIRRKKDAPRVTSFTMGDLPSLSFLDGQDEFEVHIQYVPLLEQYFEIFYKPRTKEPKIVVGDK